jgi:receptor protein-tyrosine kinase
LASLEREAGAERKVIMVTSPNAADGKTTVVTNLGIAMAQTGKKVLLVDADFRRPQLGKTFEVHGPCELTSLILSGTPVTEYKHSDLANTTSISNLWVLPNDGADLPIEQLIHSSRLAKIIERLRSEFDIVLIDVPPLLNLADARIIGRHVDGAALIVRAGQTEKWELIGACQCLQDDGIPVFGTVLNNWNPEGMSNRYYYH